MARLPSDPSRLTGHRKHQAFKVIEDKPAPQPALPKSQVWPQLTKDWWQMWGRSPLSAEYTETDWSELLTCAKFHALMWTGSPTMALKAAAEYRQRIAKFGATPYDRQRLRITLAMADIEEDRAEARAEAKKKNGARARRGPHLVPDSE